MRCQTISHNLLPYLHRKLPKRVIFLFYAYFKWDSSKSSASIEELLETLEVWFGHTDLSVDPLSREIHSSQNTESLPFGEEFITKRSRILENHVAIKRNHSPRKCFLAEFFERLFFGKMIPEMVWGVHIGSNPHPIGKRVKSEPHKISQGAKLFL